MNVYGRVYFREVRGQGTMGAGGPGKWRFQSDTGGSVDPGYTGNRTPFVTALLKNNGQNRFTLKAGDAEKGRLRTIYDGKLPVVTLIDSPHNYAPMHQEGAIILGTGGGDNSNNSRGSFFEGVMTKGYPADAADDAVQADILSVGYAIPACLTK